jgi:hypothetical protein
MTFTEWLGLIAIFFLARIAIELRILPGLLAPLCALGAEEVQKRLKELTKPM